MEHLSYPPKPDLPMDLILHLPEGISPVGDWMVPKPETQNGPSGMTRGYSGEVTFERRMRIDKHRSAGKLEVGCTAKYQVCNTTNCLRPEPVEAMAVLEVVDR